MRPFFSVAIRHDFFNGARAAVEWEATPSTRRLLDATGCAVAPGRADLEVFYDADCRNRLAQRLAGARGSFKLAWRWHLRDFDLGCISAGAPPRAGRVLFLTSRRAVRDDGGEWRLHAGARAGARDWRASGTHRFTPHPIVRFHLDSADLPAPDAKQGKRYSVRISARATYWKYFLPAAWPAASVRIVDSAGEEAFTPATPETLADGRAVLCVRSQRPIALAQRPGANFQLTCVEDGIEQVVFDRLPAAAPGAFVREAPEDSELLVSEIHV